MPLFLPNPDLLAELMEDGDVIDGLLEQVAKAAELAQAFAPVETGEYRDSIKAAAAGGSVYLLATDWKANFIEYGTANNPPQAPLRRGITGVGLRLVEEEEKP